MASKNEPITTISSEAVQNWQQILWREWRSAEDEEYAAHLFPLLADTPAHPFSFFIILFFSALTGMMIGMLSGFVLTTDIRAWQQLAWAGMAVGAARGCFVGWGLSWRQYLARLSASLPVGTPDNWLGGGVMLGAMGGLIFGPPFWITMLGLLWGVGGLIEWLNTGAKAPTNEYTYRIWYFWWPRYPPPQQVIAALQQAYHHHPHAEHLWREALHRYAQQQAAAEPLGMLLAHLQSDDWISRFIARHKIVAHGAEAVPTLKRLAADEEFPARPVAHWLLKLIK